MGGRRHPRPPALRLEEMGGGRSARLLVMATREETPETRVRLTGRQAGFSHDLPMRRVVLGPLTGEDTVRVLRALAVPEQEDEEKETARLERFGGWLHDETGGQPFFLSETLSDLV